MPVSTNKDTATFKYKTATQGKVGQPVTLNSTTPDECILASAKTNVPLGVLVNEPKQNDFAAVELPGNKIVVAAAGGTIAVGALCGVAASGVFSTVTLAATQDATTNFIWGVALTAVANGKLFRMLFTPSTATLA